MAVTKKTYRSANDYLPERLTLNNLRKAAKKCHGCPLYKYAKQTVFSEGNADARIIFVGEIPGEKEDELGKPFVGPAGKLLREVIEETDIKWEDIYFTNVVKHFKFIISGNRKLHRSPVGSEVKACMPWFNAEVKVLQPKMIVCLGATAAKAIVSKKISIKAEHGKIIKMPDEHNALVTFHPSAILRAPQRRDRHAMRKILFADLTKVKKFVYA